ncbi:hypothetical protein M406DRAFT_357598 [Cryphonectria parasitica EP155]|uniref:Uncharacterized protein n=1 Tax=Cryphonectria parasitica (strain ATCC 38755 / EP155) TaxID=660469 RepID=A0A9P4XWW0_CRYP1|nr:uncharacterized protein M406DRAFT_357598 [Cryphonectria parasitica EP155]KAF3762817.1 hypothetical protein M406DRAFT_357598 [Cryphonectria parasitica EP155]
MSEPHAPLPTHSRSARQASTRTTRREQYPPSTHSNRHYPQRNASSRTNTSARTLSRDPSFDAVPRRPTNGLQRVETVQTQYMEMLLSLDKIPRFHNILASFFGWLLLAGFVVFPGTFTNIQELSADPTLAGHPDAAAILNDVQNLPLVIVAAIVCGIGTFGLIWLAVCWRTNYVWLLNKIFLPGATNAVAGLISTLIAVYTQKDGEWSVMAKATGAVEAGALIVCGSLFILCTLMLQWVKRKHAKETRMFEKSYGDAGILEKTGKKLMAPAVEPQSVI